MKLRVVIDDKTIFDKMDDAETFLAFWNDLPSDLLRQRRVIEEVKVNDRLLTDHIESYIQEHFSEIQSFCVTTTSLDDFLSNLLDETRVLNEKLIEKSTAVSDVFYRSVLTPDDWEQFKIYMNGINSLCSAVHGCVQIIDAMGEPRVDHMNMKTKLVTVLSDFNLKVAMLEEPILERDYTTVGDMIVYELMPIFEQLRNL